ncbi:MAG: hypothetical protein K1W37_07655 [Lachnospiraceae bacterium]
MGRKVTENHKVVEQSSQGAAEDLIKQQNAAEDFVLGEREEESQEADAGKEEGQQKENQRGGEGISVTDQEKSMKELLEDSVETKEGAELAGKEEGQKEKVFDGTVVLTGATTYMDSGIRYFKNKPVKVTDQRVYEQLLRTGLFVHI